MKVRRAQHVSVPRPPGDEAHRKAVGFYSEILGLAEIPKPRTFTDIEVTWFVVGDGEIHVYATGPNEPLPHSGAHFCLEVDDLSLARRQLENAGYACEDAVPIPNRPRFY